MNRWHAALARIGLSTPLRRDIAGAVVLLGLVLTGVVSPSPAMGPTSGEPLLLGITLVVLECSGIAFRRIAPLAGLSITVGAVAGQSLLLPVTMQSGFATVFVVYAVAAYRPRNTAAVAIGIAATLDLSLAVASDLVGELNALSGPGTSPTSMVGLVVAGRVVDFALPGLLGAYMRAHRAYLAELEIRAGQLEYEREAQAARAVADERGRIARELHDVAAHHLSGIVVQAGAAESLVDDEPDQAKQLLRELRSQGRETLRSMRFLVGVLRAGGHSDSAPQPGFHDIERLIDQARASGAEVVLDPLEFAPDLTPETGLASYRVVQEALSNARRHATGAAVRVQIGRDGGGIVLEIDNDAPPAGPVALVEKRDGYGLVGMKERIDLLGGDLQVGPRRGGGWLVRARLPLEGPT